MARARVVAPLAGSVAAIAVAPGQHVVAGDVVAIVESMKMEHEVRAAADGVVETVRCAVGDVVADGDEI
nr:biotin/lipoyl-containing protein [Caldimonas sp.]